MKRSKGFTLVELLAVIAILGILVSITTVAVNTLRKKQEEKNKENVISSILTGAKEYNAKERIQVNDSRTVKFLKDNNFVDFDENKYPDFLNEKYKVTKSQCEDKPLKVKYWVEFDSKEYNDCGCEEQNSNNDKSSELCISIIEKND